MSSHRIGGQNPCSASCFASVFFKQTVEFYRPPSCASCFALVFFKQTIEFNHLFHKDRGKTASAARILSPNVTRRPLPCLLIQSFFYVNSLRKESELSSLVWITRSLFSRKEFQTSSTSWKPLNAMYLVNTNWSRINYPELGKTSLFIYSYIWFIVCSIPLKESI